MSLGRDNSSDLILMTLTFFRNIGQVFCRISHNGKLFYAIFIIYIIHTFLSTLFMTVGVDHDHLTEVVFFLGFFTVKLLFFDLFFFFWSQSKEWEFSSCCLTTSSLSGTVRCLTSFLFPALVL